MSAPRRRVLIVVNKYWECEPLLALLLSPWEKALPRVRKDANSAAPDTTFPYPDPAHFQWHLRRRIDNKLPGFQSEADQLKPGVLPAAPSVAPRLVLPFATLDVEVWCISDLLEHLPEFGQFQSSSYQKMQQLPQVLQQPADLVIAVGTAGHPGDGPLNGCVTIGTQTFLHDGADATDTNYKWQAGPFDQLLPSAFSAAAFQQLLPAGRLPDAEDRFHKTRNYPFERPRIFADYHATAVSFNNVWDYKLYTDKDRQAEEAFRAQYPAGLLRSVETTHGLIRVAAGDKTPFLFVSGITDRSQYFADDVQPNEYAQNVAAAHNAGMAVAWLLPQVDQLPSFR